MILREVKVVASPDARPGEIAKGHWDETQPLDQLQAIVTAMQAWIDQKNAAATDPTKAAMPIPTNDV